MKSGIKIKSINFLTPYDRLTICTIKYEYMGKMFTSIGKTVCSYSDVYNENLGKRIAESRAKAKMYNRVYRHSYGMFKYLTLYASKHKELYEFQKFLADREETHVNRLINENTDR